MTDEGSAFYYREGYPKVMVGKPRETYWDTGMRSPRTLLIPVMTASLR